ncbi:tautomerase family protein [Lacisediminimonas profundi]|uniref:tautomerase family protein n=1 Tax=Lacisediminimonas profundi TaxID=2603856 RepID=UPI00124B744F|nr:tautomerase family protein [Lacisediminimonas profundi]
MILIEVTLIAGRSPEQKTAMFREMTQAASIALKVPADTVRIALNEIRPDHFAAGGIAKTGPSSNAAPAPAPAP